MLLNVHIKNIVLIEDANITFTDGLNILTGETGAGKSIILGALKIGMGERLPKDILRDQTQEGFCQLLFFTDDPALLEKLDELSVCPAEDGGILITRRILNGRTINTINEMTVTAAKLKEVSALLVDMHAQQEQQVLLKKAEHLKLLDKFGRETIEPLKSEYVNRYHTYEQLKKEAAESSMSEAERTRRLEFVRYEIREIEDAKLSLSEDDELERQYRKMVHAKDITEVMSGVYQITGYGESSSAGNEIGRALSDMRQITDLDPELSDVYESLVTIDSLLNDFNVSLNDYMQGMEFDEAEFHGVENRLNKINECKSKYGRTIPDILNYLNERKEEEERLLSYEEHEADLAEEITRAKSGMEQAAEALSAERKRLAKILCGQVSAALGDLNFARTAFDMVFERAERCGAFGWDHCYFTVSTNVGEAERPLYEAASGGELSRIMLALKSCMADKDQVDTLIFDEIDAGISGRAASSVAEKLSVIGKAHQVISITHLPQIAAMADSHYAIEKTVRNGKTVTQIKRLSEEESVMEIARLLGGASVTDAAIQNARDMKELAKKTKIN